MKSRILLSATTFIKEKVITYCCLSLFFSLFFTGSFTNASAQTKLSRTQHIAVRKTAVANTPNSNAPIIDYFVVFDPSGKAVAERRGGMAKYAQEVVDSINSVLRNSHVDGRFRLAGHMEIAERAQSINQGLGLISAHAEVRRRRDAVKGDLVVLLSEPVNDGASGLATQEAQSIDAGFSSVRASMAATSYTAAHEAGHNIGCRHSRQQVDAGEHEYAVGASRPQYRTVMSGPADNVGGQVPIFSGPQSVWNGVVLGSATEDNVRMLRERMPIVAQFSESQTSISFSPAAWNPDSRAQTIEVKMTTTAAYLVTSDAAWLTTDLPNGYKSRDFRITVGANSQKESRVGHLRFELVGDGEPTIVNYTVTQQGTAPNPQPKPEPVQPKPEPKKPEDPKKPEPKPILPKPEEPKKPVEPKKPEPKPVVPKPEEPKKPVEPTKPVEPKKPEPVQPPKEESKWEISPREIHIDAKGNTVSLTIDVPDNFSLQTPANWFSSTLWQGKGKTTIQLIVDANQEEKARTAELEVYFTLPQSGKKMREVVKIVQDAPIPTSISRTTTEQPTPTCRWEGDLLHIDAPATSVVEIITLDGQVVQREVMQQSSCTFRLSHRSSLLLVRIVYNEQVFRAKVVRN